MRESPYIIYTYASRASLDVYIYIHIHIYNLLRRSIVDALSVSFVSNTYTQKKTYTAEQKHRYDIGTEIRLLQ